MAEKSYSKRETDTRWDNIEHRLFDEKEGYLPRIERQTMKTNGRVNRHDKYFLVAGTALIVAAVIKYPELVGIIHAFL